MEIVQYNQWLHGSYNKFPLNYQIMFAILSRFRVKVHIFDVSGMFYDDVLLHN
jgi:hypothetical protein